MDIFRIHSVIIQPRTRAVGNAGGVQYDYSSSNVPDFCRIVPKNVNLQVRYGQYTFYWSHIIYFDHDPQAVVDMRILYGSRKFTVRGAFNAHELNRIWLVFVTEGD